MLHWKLFNLNKICNIIPIRSTSVVPRPKPKKGTIKHRNLIKNTEDKLQARGFLRSQKPYQPPENVKELLDNVLADINLTEPFFNQEQKFSLLKTCFSAFNHAVPNSMLHQIEKPFDLYAFYETPVSTTTPLDEFRRKELPPNLHIQYDYVRFDPETDTLYNGLTAFPESSTLVTGLRERKKYKGHTQKHPYYYDNWSDYLKD